jgi:hypothetical protein
LGDKIKEEYKKMKINIKDKNQELFEESTIQNTVPIFE